ncbi:MAG: hypothetical protein H7Y88_13615, partial [Phycisphaerales bacterium]|nr:hypothetical protein [Phycisphaerales bacterium]
RADFDSVNGVGSGDITSFLSAWFLDLANQTTAADFDCSGSTNSADITAFLELWFLSIGGSC